MNSERVREGEKKWKEHNYILSYFSQRDAHLHINYALTVQCVPSSTLSSWLLAFI